jgi:hypothetical protein
MHRFYMYLVAFISITTMPLAALADNTAESLIHDTQSRGWTHTVGIEGLHFDIPSVDYNLLIKEIRMTHAYNAQREQQISRYLHDKQMNSKDAVIAAIMPGGLLYAAVRKNNLVQAKTRLAEVTEIMDELSYDLLAMQAKVNTLTVAQLQ